MNPLARTADLTIRKLADEVVAYDSKSHKMHCLNPLSAVLWQHCDGHNDLAALAALAGRMLNVPAAEAFPAVKLALEQLQRRNLLESAEPVDLDIDRVSRRRALRKLALLAALPIVMTLKAPSLAWATTIIAKCRTNADCPAGQICNTNHEERFGPHLSVVVSGACISVAPPCGTVGMPCTGDFQGTCCSGLGCNAGICTVPG
jgi:Cys-rich repeat protein